MQNDDDKSTVTVTVSKLKAFERAAMDRAVTWLAKQRASDAAAAAEKALRQATKDDDDALDVVTKAAHALYAVKEP